MSCIRWCSRLVPLICAVLCACGISDRHTTVVSAVHPVRTSAVPHAVDSAPVATTFPSRPSRYSSAGPGDSTALGSYSCGFGLSRPDRDGNVPYPSCDFSISVSSSTVSAKMGATSTPINISVLPIGGFSGTASVDIAGLPAGVSCSPACPVTIAAGKSAQVSFVVPGNAVVANLSLTLQATSGNVVHTMPLTLGVTTSLQAYWNLTENDTFNPANPATVDNATFVSGWAFETTPITSVSVLIDGTVVGTAFYGLPRPDISSLPGGFEDCGFSVRLDTSKYSNGAHTLAVTVTDSVGNVSTMLHFPTNLQSIQITVNNPAPPVTGPVANLTLNASNTSLTVGNIVQYTASASDGSSNPVYPQFTWSSSDPTIAKVTPSGVVYPLAAGTATISVSAGGLTKQVMTTVAAGSGAPGTIQVSIGPEEVVDQHTRDACMEGDVPDGGARAVRLADGSILLIAGDDSLNFADVGQDFWSLKRRCVPTLVSVDSPVANTFQNRQWIYALYNDGTTIHALVHNEFHDPIASTCKPGDSTDGNPCQYNSVTYASSNDGGHTFQIKAAPQNVVSPPPVEWTPPGQGTQPPYYGSQEPTNIVHASDGYYYARFGWFPPPDQPYYERACVMRTKTLSDASSWRAWDGTAFELQMSDPYVTPGAALCADTSNGPYPGESLTFDTYLNAYVSLGLDSDLPFGTTCGFHFALSSDLVHWSPQQLIAPAYVPAPSECQQPGAGEFAGSYAYASIIDPDDTSVNFETPGRTAYIYFTRFNDNIEDRDLVRIPVMFTTY